MSAPAPLTLAALLAGSRVFALREAVVAALAAMLPEVSVKAHPGKLDIHDVDVKSLFRAPTIAVAVTRLRAPEGRMSGLHDLPVELTAYIVTEDMPVAGAAKPIIFRDELGYAICDGLLEILGRDPVARWDLDEIGFPEEATAVPLLTVKSEERGTAYYAVTWRQVLYGLGEPFMAMSGEPPEGAQFHALLPGDPDRPDPPDDPS